MLHEETPRILLADPSARMRRILRINLESASCQVVETDGADLLARVRALSFAALVINLDVRDPNVCGAVNVLRRRTPGAVVAGYSILPMDDRVRQLCIDYYVETPFDLTQFVAHVRTACSRAANLTGISGADLAL